MKRYLPRPLGKTQLTWRQKLDKCRWHLILIFSSIPPENKSVGRLKQFSVSKNKYNNNSDHNGKRNSNKTKYALFLKLLHAFAFPQLRGSRAAVPACPIVVATMAPGRLARPLGHTTLLYAREAVTTS